MVTATAAKRREYVRWARERGGWLIEDDVESEFAPVLRRAETLFSLDPDRVIYLNSFSKTLFPSLRAGYLALPDALRGRGGLSLLSRARARTVRPLRADRRRRFRAAPEPDAPQDEEMNADPPLCPKRREKSLLHFVPFSVMIG